jgi:hypothetical protein
MKPISNSKRFEIETMSVPIGHGFAKTQTQCTSMGGSEDMSSLIRGSMTLLAWFRVHRADKYIESKTDLY